MREYVLRAGPRPDRGPTRWPATWPRRASRCAAPRKPLTVGGRTIPAGAYVVSNAQPAGRLVRNLLDLKTEQSAEFIARQEERRKRRQPDQIYDITAWSLPLIYDVDVVTSATAITGEVHAGAGVVRRCPRRRVTVGCRQGRVSGAVGYGGGGAHRRGGGPGPARAKRRRRLHAGRPRAIPSARRSCARPATRPTCRRECRRWPRKHGAEVVPIDSAYIESGTSLGSPENGFIKRAARAAGVGHADLVALGGLDPLRARAALRPGGDRGAHRRARPRRLRATSTWWCCRRATTPGRSATPVLNALEGLDSPGRHARDAGRSHAVGGRQRRRAARHQPLLKDGRPDTPATTGAAPSSGGSSASHAPRPRAASATAAPSPPGRASAVATSTAVRGVRPSRPRPEPEPRAPVSTSTRRSSRIANGPTRSLARCCAPRSTPTTG